MEYNEKGIVTSFEDNDLDLFVTPLYSRDKDITELISLDSIISSKDNDFLSEDAYKKVYAYVYELYNDVDEEIVTKSIIKKVLDNTHVDLNNSSLPLKLLNNILVLAKAEDFMTYPSFYLQTLLDEIKEASVKARGKSECEYTVESFVRNYLKITTPLINPTDLMVEHGDLDEVFITDIGVCILPDKAIEDIKDSRKMLAAINFNKETNTIQLKKTALFDKKPKRMEIDAVYSMLDWREQKHDN